MQPMSSRELWLAAIRMQPLDRLPFWPKLVPGYPLAQPAPFHGMPLEDLHDWIGSDKHQPVGAGVRLVHQRAETGTQEDGETKRTWFRTPYGELHLVRRFDAGSNSWHPTEHPVKSVDDIRLMTAFYEDTTVEFSEEGRRRAVEICAKIGRNVVTTNQIGTSPLMYWVEYLAGVENAHLLLVDHQAEVEALFDAMHAVLLRKTEMMAEISPVDIFYLNENTSTTLISPDQYRRYCARHIGDYAAIMRAADRNLVLHMCGHLKDLLPDLARIPVRAFEAFTSPSLGNTTLLDGRRACPGHCLVGGTNAMLWTRPASEIIAGIEAALDELPHHRGIVVTSAGAMPPVCRPDTIKQVCAWVKQYPVRI